MPYYPPKKHPRFADLKGILAQTKQSENPLYQTIQVLIERLEQSTQLTEDQISALDPSNPLANVAVKTATYHTKNNEVAALPNSVQLLAGLGIEFDDTLPNKRTIKLSSGGNHYDAPLTDGHLTETELIFALGECIIVQVPIP